MEELSLQYMSHVLGTLINVNATLRGPLDASGLQITDHVHTCEPLIRRQPPTSISFRP